MASYMNQLILTVVVCQVASMLAPNADAAKRYLRLVCGLVTLLTVFSPVRNLIQHGEAIGVSLHAFVTASAAEENNVLRDSLEATTYTILAYAEERYGFDTQDAEVTFFTNEEEKVDEMMVFFRHGNADDRDRLQSELEEELGITVHIFLERRESDGG